MKNDAISINKPMLVKAFIISFILLAVSFTAGIILGKSDKAILDRTSADSNDIQEQLSNCSYKLQEITTKHLNMVDIAKKKGLLDSEGGYDPDVVCTAMKEEEEEPDEAKTAGGSEVQDEDTPSLEKKPEKPLPTEKPIEKKEVKAPEKKENPSSDAKDCLFSIQLFAGTSKEQALAAQKKYKISNTRLVEGIVKEKSWYRIRYGCFSTKNEAEKFLPGIKDEIDGAIVVAE